MNSVSLLNTMFYTDSLSMVMSSLVFFVTAVVGLFSVRYLEGTSNRSYFFVMFFATAVFVLFMVNANHFLLLWLSWTLANYCLSKLIGYKHGWAAAQASSRLVQRFLFSGSIILGIGLLLLYNATGFATVTEISHTTQVSILGLICLVIAAMIQSALVPFYRWIVSSLNAPTPVSAFMHAGLVNGGGFLLARFAPLFLQNPSLLKIIFCLGIATAIIGTTFKLLQSNIKSMLACSTIGQMGFMIAQCGMGLFPAAITHACFHGLFKAYLFLDSGKVIQEKQILKQKIPSLTQFTLALLCGSLTSFCFAQANQVAWLTTNTQLILHGVALIAGTQLALPFIRLRFLSLFFVPIISSGIGMVYGLTVHSIEHLLEPLGINTPQPLNGVYIIGFGILVIIWLSMVFKIYSLNHPFICRMYMYCLNASQPDERTITAHPSDYYHEGTDNVT